MSLFWQFIIFYLWVFSNPAIADCRSSIWTDLISECDHTDNFTPTIAIQTFSANTYPHYSSYSSLSLFVKGSNGLNIMPHCIIMDTTDDITITVVREWILQQKPWPKYHGVGNMITFNDIHGNTSQYILFNNQCIINQNTTNKHAIILVFNQNFSSWNIQSNPYSNCNDKSIVNTIYDTLHDINCSSLPIRSNLNWNFQILPSTAPSTQTAIVYVSSFNFTRTIVYGIIILCGNVSGAAILYSILKGKQNQLQKEIELILSKKHIDTNTNSNMSFNMDIDESKLCTPNTNKAEQIMSNTATPKQEQKPVIISTKTPKTGNKIRISIMDDRMEHSLASLPSIPNNKNRNYSYSANELNIHYRNESNITYLMPALSEHNTALSELDDSILNDDYHNNLDDVLSRINGIHVSNDVQMEDDNNVKSGGLPLPDLDWRYSISDGNDSNHSSSCSAPIPNVMKSEGLSLICSEVMDIEDNGSSSPHPKEPTIKKNDNKDVCTSSISV